MAKQLLSPLAIGKPNAVLNEFYRRVARDPSLQARYRELTGRDPAP